jgi:hypothetical protein
VRRACDTKCLTQPTGAASKHLRFGSVRKTAKPSHSPETLKRYERAEEHTAGLAIGQARDANAIVHSIDEVDVRHSRSPKEDRIGRGSSDERMRSGIREAEVRFDLYDAATESLTFAMMR